MNSGFQSIIWKGQSLELLDQRKIPKKKEYIQIQNLSETIVAIQEMAVRGAPAIAITGIYGLVLELKSKNHKPEYKEFLKYSQMILESRPTAVNLKFALDGFLNLFPEEKWNSLHYPEILERAENYANQIFSEDLEQNLKIGKLGAGLFHKKIKELTLITHCNTGALATTGHGTALGVIRSLRDLGYKLLVYADETRPYHQGSRLTAFELMEEKIECNIITDSMAAWVMQNRKVDAVIVGADRIARNGDTANKIGTYSLAIVAKAHSIPFYVAATSTGFDLNLSDGSKIPIEMRSPDEVLRNSVLKNSEGKPLLEEGILSPKGAMAINPSFDVTPAHYIAAIITEKGIISPVTEENVIKIIKR
jgi:methylthioribose-1-phosphate isomerase